MSLSSSAGTGVGHADQQIGGLATPCIGVCLVDASGFCRGCARTLGEIGAWTALSHSARLSLMEALPARKAALAGDTLPQRP